MMDPTIKAGRGTEAGGAGWWLAPLFAALPIFAFQFGVGNQVEQFSLIRRFADPGFLQGDFYIDGAVQFGPRFYYCQLLAGLTQLAPLPQVVFALTFLTNLALAWVTYDAARRMLRADPRGAAIASLLAVANSGIALGLAGYLRFDSYQPASLAIPFALFGFAQLVVGRRLLGAAAFALASLAHPLVGVETAAFAYLACACAERVRRRGLAELVRGWAGYVPSGMAFGAVVLVAWVLPSQAAPAIPDFEFFSILPAFRAPHHYLALTFPLAHYATATLFVTAIAYFLAGALRAQGLRFELVALGIAVAAVLGACAANVLLVDLLHSRAYATAQVFRMLLLAKWLGFLLFAHAASRWIVEEGWFGWVAAAVPVIVTGDAQPVALVAAIVSVEAARRLDLAGPARIGLAALLALVAATVAFKASPRHELVRAGVGALCLWLWVGPTAKRLAPRLTAAAAVAALVVVSFAFRSAPAGGEPFRSTFTWDDLTGPDADVARWVRDNTPRGGVWLTPPDFESFRLMAERPIVVDFTSVPLQDMAMREWRARLRTVYGEVGGAGFTALDGMMQAHRSATPERLRVAGERYGAGYAVLYNETPWPTAPLYRNSRYKAVALAKLQEPYKP